MTTLAELTLEEQRLADLVARVRGTIPDSIFDRYREVHRQYVALAWRGDIEDCVVLPFFSGFLALSRLFLRG